MTWVFKRIDASVRDWLFAVRACVSPPSRDTAERVEGFWEPDGSGLVGLSVRTLFDLWLSAKNFEPGDRIVFSALTVADMPRIAREHGLEVAAVDVDPLTGEPDLTMMEAVTDTRTRAFVYTHLFGARGDVTGAMELARVAEIDFIEDCAEAYTGPNWRGHPESDLTLFSFGPIKTATAFGGGLARVADPDTRERMRELASMYPVQTAREFLGRVLKYGLLMLATAPATFGLVVRLLDTFGPGHDAVLNRLTRGFPGPNFFQRIRRRPADALLRLLERRLQGGDAPWRRRVAHGERLVRSLGGVTVPAAGARPHAYWVMPVLAPDPGVLVQRLADSGFHATRGRAFAVVEHDRGVRARAPLGAHRLQADTVYLPFYPEMPDGVLDELGRIVCAVIVPTSAASDSLDS